jgi:hypothetical protein
LFLFGIELDVFCVTYPTTPLQLQGIFNSSKAHNDQNPDLKGEWA